MANLKRFFLYPSERYAHYVILVMIPLWIINLLSQIIQLLLLTDVLHVAFLLEVYTLLKFINVLLWPLGCTLFVLMIWIFIFHKRARLKLNSLARVVRESRLIKSHGRLVPKQTLQLHLDSESGLKFMKSINSEEQAIYLIEQFFNSLECLKLKIQEDHKLFRGFEVVQGTSFKIKFGFFKKYGFSLSEEKSVFYRVLLAHKTAFISTLKPKRYFSTFWSYYSKKKLLSFELTREELLSLDVDEMRNYFEKKKTLNKKQPCN